MLLTFEKMSQLGKRHILLQSYAKIRGIPFMPLQVTMADSGEGQHPPPPPLFLHQTEARRDEKKYFCDCPNLPTYRGVASNLAYRGS